MNSVLIFNLINSKKSVENLLSPDILLTAWVYDFCNVLNNSNVINLKQMLEQQDIDTPKAIESYMNFYSRVIDQADKTFPEIKLGNVWTFWLTDFSEKHPYYHWGRNIFYLENFLKKNEKLLENASRIFFLIPKDEFLLSDLIKSFAKCNLYKEKIYFKSPAKKFFPLIKFISFFFNLIKTFIGQEIAVAGYKNSIKKINTPNLIFHLHSYKARTSKKNMLNHFHQLAINKPYQFFELPFLHFDLKDITYLPEGYFNQRPGLLDVWKITIQFLKNITLLLKSKSDLSSVHRFIYMEIFQAIMDTNLWLFYFWQKKYFKKISVNSLVFYETEFYKFGRLTSGQFKKLNQPNIKYYGVQHGAFSSDHLVYNLTAELNNSSLKNPFPLPQKFIVWSDYFKKIIDNTKKLNIEVLGNFLYKKDIAPIPKTNFTKILWCATGKETFYDEYKIIYKLIKDNPQLVITFRNHPSGFIKRENITDLFTFSNFNLSTNKFIEDEFAVHDVVVTSYHSTVTIDAVVYQIPLIRLITTTQGLKYESPMVKNVKNYEELIESMQALKQAFPTAQNMVYTQNDKWELFLGKELI